MIFTWIGIHWKSFPLSSHFGGIGPLVGVGGTKILILFLQQVSPVLGHFACFGFSHQDGGRICLGHIIQSGDDLGSTTVGRVSKHWPDRTHEYSSPNVEQSQASSNASSHSDASNSLPEIVECT